jgi:hypothetical protein
MAEAPRFADEEVVEVGLLLPAHQLNAFEAAARRQGLTAAQMLRRLLSGFLGEADKREPGCPA